MPKVRGSKTGKYVTATFDSKDNSKSRFPSLKTTKDLILLSIKGNEYCANEYLKAIVQQAVKTHETDESYSGVKGKATFLIADEIYWHNLKNPSTVNENELRGKALQMGETFFESNVTAFLAPLDIDPVVFIQTHADKSVDEKIQIINQLALQKGKNFEIIRWRDWIEQNNFHTKLPEIMPLYNSVEGLKFAIDQSVTEFARRHANDEEGSLDLWLARSRGYLEHESPSIMLQAASLGYNFVIYPGSVLPPFLATKEYFIVDNHVPRIEKGKSILEECTHDKHCLHVDKPASLVNWLEVNFERRDELVPRSRRISPDGRNKFKKGDKDSTLTLGRPSMPRISREGITFFSNSQETAPAASSDLQQGNNSTSGVSELTAEGLEHRLTPVPKDEFIASPISQGVGRALQNEFLSCKKGLTDPRVTSAPLAKVFEGITQGVLAADIPLSEKITILKALIEPFTTNSHSANISPVESPSAEMNFSKLSVA